MTLLLNHLKQALFSPFNIITTIARDASKKAGSISRNPKGSGIKKHRGLKRYDGNFVQAGTTLVLQRTLRFHPGLNVGLGRNGTVFAITSGRVYITCEKVDPRWDHPWVRVFYAGRENNPFFKKYLNVVPDPQHRNFKLIDKI